MAQVVPSYSNSLQQQVIAAAEAAGFEIPANIAATYAEHGAARRSNQWHVALGLASDGPRASASNPRYRHPCAVAVGPSAMSGRRRKCRRC